MAFAVVIVRISRIRIRSNCGRQSNVTTALIFEKMHLVGKPDAFFILNLYSVRRKLFFRQSPVRDFFVTKRTFYAILVKLPPPILVTGRR